LTLAMNIFGKNRSNDQKELARNVCRKITHEMRAIDRQVNQIKREEAKVRKAIKVAAEKNEKEACKILAKEIVNSRKAVAKMYQTKAHLNSVCLFVKNQAASVNMIQSVEKSANVMKSLQYLVNLPESAASMRNLSKEMMKAGIIEEIMEEAIDNATQSETDDDDIQAEIEKIVNEVTLDPLKNAPSAASHELESLTTSTAEEEEIEEDLDAMRARLEALKS
ncbi:Charged multivesicular body protein 3, partial [Trichinella nativa]